MAGPCSEISVGLRGGEGEGGGMPPLPRPGQAQEETR